MARACIALSVVVLIAMASLAAMGGETQISDVRELAGTWRIAGQHLDARAPKPALDRRDRPGQ
jgi:hypothetical protein